MIKCALACINVAILANHQCRLGRTPTFAAAESSPLLSNNFASPLVLLALAACSFASLDAFAYRQQSSFSRR